MSNFLKPRIFVLALLVVMVLPVIVFGQDKPLVPACGEEGCGFVHLIELVNNIVGFILFRLAVPIAAIMFAYAGFLLLFSGGEQAKRTKAKNIFVNVGLGLAFALAAWLIVKTIFSVLGYTGASWIGF
jgi:hypothetical protein